MPNGAPVPSVSLTLPSREYVGVARLVAGGMTSRLGLPYETVDNLQTAIEALLGTIPGDADRPAKVEISADGRRLTVSVGPLPPAMLARRFPGGIPIDLRGLLTRLVDEVSVETTPASSIALHVALPSGHA